MSLVFSRGQQQADMAGPLNQLIVPGDATANHGYNAGRMVVYTGAAPATADAAETGTVLIIWALNATAFGAPSAATPTVTTAGAVSNVSASATGTAGYGRLTTGTTGTGFPTLEDGTLSTTQRRIMFAVGTSGADLNFNTLGITSGATASLVSLSITHG